MVVLLSILWLVFCKMFGICWTARRYSQRTAASTRVKRSRDREGAVAGGLHTFSSFVETPQAPAALCRQFFHQLLRGDEDRIPDRREGRRVGQVQLFELIHPHAGG